MFWQPATSPRLSNLYFCHLCHTVVHSRETKLACQFLICFSLHLLLCVCEREGQINWEAGSQKTNALSGWRERCTNFWSSAIAWPTADWLSGEWVTGKWKEIGHGHQRGARPHRRMAFVKYSYCMDTFLFYFGINCFGHTLDFKKGAAHK